MNLTDSMDSNCVADFGTNFGELSADTRNVKYSISIIYSSIDAKGMRNTARVKFQLDFN